MRQWHTFREVRANNGAVDEKSSSAGKRRCKFVEGLLNEFKQCDIRCSCGGGVQLFMVLTHDFDRVYCVEFVFSRIYHFCRGALRRASVEVRQDGETAPEVASG